MKVEDFAAWLSAISGMSEDQRREAMVALEKASVVGGAAAASAKKGGKRGRQEDALGTTGVERVAAQGCPHCAGREIVGWGRSHGLLRFRCRLRAHLQYADQDADGASAQEGPLARSRARDDRGQEPGQDRGALRIHPTTAFRWRHRFLRAPEGDKPRSLRGIVEADETFVLEFFRADGRPAEKGEGPRQAASSFKDNIPILVARDRNGATFDAILAQVDGASVSLALAGIVTPGNHLIGDGGKAIATFARRAGIAFHTVPSPGKPSPAAPHLHINNVNAYHGRLKQWLNRFNGVATKNLPNYLGWRRALEAWGDKLEPPSWIKGAIGNGPYQQITL